MNSLTIGFLLTVGMGWALTEGCVAAGNSNWLPLIGFLIAFTFIFGAIGCLELSDAATNLIGSTFTLVLGFALLGFAFSTTHLGAGVTTLKTLGALSIVAAGIISFLPAKKDEQHG